MTAQDRLLEQYQKSIDAILKKLQKIRYSGSAKAYERRILRLIKKEIAKLNTAAAKALQDIVIKAYSDAERAAYSALGKSYPGFVETTSVQNITSNAYDLLSYANQFIGRRITDTIRDITLKATAEKMSTYQSIRELQKAISKEFAEYSLSSVPTKSGKNWGAEAYAKMVARTTAAEAGHTAIIQTGIKEGRDLVKFTTHFPTCEVCAPIQGRVYSISGADERFPALGDLPGFRDGFFIIHPNCRHSFNITLEEMWTDEERERYIADAKKPIEGDNRTTREVNAYNAEQAKNRRKRETKKQYKRYQAVLGEDAPQSLAAFTRIKNDPEKYADIKAFYRYMGLNPQSNAVYYKIDRDVKKEYPDFRGAFVPPDTSITPYLVPLYNQREPFHAMHRMLERQITDDEVRAFIKDAAVMVERWDGTLRTYYAPGGTTRVKHVNEEWIVNTVWGKEDFDGINASLLRIIKKHGK